MVAPLLNAALQFTRWGKPVFPCKEDRAPFTRHGFKDATCNEDQIRAWWTKSPDALIGMPTGEVSGLVVLDIDVKNGHCGEDSLWALQEAHDKLPDTVEALTTTGGRHLYFCYPGVRVKSTSSKLGDGLDVRGDGGYVIVPPSRINGKAYEWEASNPPEPAAMPPWLVELVRDRARQGGQQQPSNGQATINKGERDVWLASQAGRLRRIGYAATDVEAMLHALNSTRCDPPLPDKDIAKIARSSEQWEPLGAPLMLTRGDSLQTKTTPPPPQFIVSWIPRRRVTLIAGDGGSGKTTFVRQLLACAADGRNFLGWEFAEPIRSFAIFSEDDEREADYFMSRLQRRLNIPWDSFSQIQWAGRLGFDNHLVQLVFGAPQLSPFWHELYERVGDEKPDLLSLDTAADLFPGNENDRAQVTYLMKTGLGKIAVDHDVAVILTAHVSDEALRGDKGFSGSRAWSNSSRSRCYLGRPKIEDGPPDPELRVFEQRKANWTALDEPTELILSDGIFHLASETVTDAARTPETVLFEQVDRLHNRGEFMTTGELSPKYAPKVCAKKQGKARPRFTTKQFEAAMDTLLQQGVLISGPPTKNATTARLMRSEWPEAGRKNGA